MIKSNNTGIPAGGCSGRAAAARFILLGILIGAILANVSQFPAIEWNIQPVVRNYGPGLVEIGQDSRYAPYLTLSQRAPGATILLPEGDSLNVECLYAFARAGKVESLAYNAATFAGAYDPSGDAVALGEGITQQNRKEEMALALKEEGAAALLVVLNRNGVWYLVDAALLPPGALEEITR
ncbi:MAG TPA: hypothetical protein PLY40_09865 [Bacillota bacterium]|nr:hypothetical protein [Bacillota bacterium]